MNRNPRPRLVNTSIVLLLGANAWFTPATYYVPRIESAGARAPLVLVSKASSAAVAVANVLMAMLPAVVRMKSAVTARVL